MRCVALFEGVQVLRLFKAVGGVAFWFRETANTCSMKNIGIMKNQ
jgi:hypothetical protein